MVACSVSTEVVARAPGDAVRRVFALQEKRKTEYKRVKMSEKNQFISLLCDSKNFLLSAIFSYYHTICDQSASLFT